MHQIHWKLREYTQAPEYNEYTQLCFYESHWISTLLLWSMLCWFIRSAFQTHFLSFSLCICIEQFSNNHCWIASKCCVRFLVCFVELKHCAFEFWGLGEVRAGALSKPLVDNQTTSREKIKHGMLGPRCRSSRLRVSWSTTTCCSGSWRIRSNR